MKWLNGQTNRLRHKLPSSGKPWGIARKAINLFLRSCAYNHHLRQAYGLAALEPLLEIPLDGVVAKALKRDAERGVLPPWPGLKHLDAKTSRRFQKYAVVMAKEMKLPALVFLDNILYIDNH